MRSSAAGWSRGCSRGTPSALRLHRHRRHRPARRRGGAAGQGRRLDRARRRRPRHRGHAPASRSSGLRERAAPLRRARRRGRDARELGLDAGGDRARDRRRQLPARARHRALGDARRPRRARRGRASSSAGSTSSTGPTASRRRCTRANDGVRLRRARDRDHRAGRQRRRDRPRDRRRRSSHEPLAGVARVDITPPLGTPVALLGGAQGARPGREGAARRAGARALRRRADGRDRRDRPRLRRRRARRPPCASASHAL